MIAMFGHVYQAFSFTFEIEDVLESTLLVFMSMLMTRYAMQNFHIILTWRN
jgi:hypothetical protein